MFRHIIAILPPQSRWKLAIKTIPYVLLIIVAKYAAYSLGLKFLDLNPLFTAIISANIFLIGFLISGTLTDHKESEKLPGDLASSLETMLDEGIILHEASKSIESKTYLKRVYALHCAILEWFHKRERTRVIMDTIRSLNTDFLAMEKQTQANFIVRLKQEQNSIRKMIHRIHAIRETSFLGSGYAIAEIITVILTVSMVFIDIQPFYESIFFVSFVSFILIYMIYFIKDLDNPFGHDDENSLVENVSLKPLVDSLERSKIALREQNMLE